MPSKSTVIRSTAVNLESATSRYLSYEKNQGVALVTLNDAQRFTPKQARDHIDGMVASGEWKRGQFRSILASDAKLLRDWNPETGAHWK